MSESHFILQCERVQKDNKNQAMAAVDFEDAAGFEKVKGTEVGNAEKALQQVIGRWSN